MSCSRCLAPCTCDAVRAIAARGTVSVEEWAYYREHGHWPLASVLAEASATAARDSGPRQRPATAARDSGPYAGA